MATDHAGGRRAISGGASARNADEQRAKRRCADDGYT